MTDPTAGNISVEALAEEFLGRKRKRERPTVAEYLARYPHLADEIRDIFPVLGLVEDFKPGSGEATGSFAAAEIPGLEKPVERLGDFRLLRVVGRGGMGIVYEAEQVSLGRHVALKVLPNQALKDGKHKRRFEREARAAARLHHTNIVPVFGVGEHDGSPYYVMQYIQGPGLDAVISELNHITPGGFTAATGSEVEIDLDRRGATAVAMAHSLVTGAFGHACDDDDREGTAAAATTGFDVTEAAEEPGVESGEGATSATGPSAAGTPHSGRLSDSFELSASSLSLPKGGSAVSGRKSAARKPTYWQTVANIGRQVADALDYAHKQGILHRDVKPSNLLLDTRGTVWVTDFGLAKVAGPGADNLTHTGDILGTMRYMPPEAFEGNSDARSDVYALGLTLYELLALQPAFAEKDRNKLIKQVTTSEPARLDRLRREIPRDLATIVQKAIEKEPSRRYATAEQLAADLERFIDDEPILARRQTELERCVRWARHNPMIAALGAALTAVLVGVTIASVVVAGHMISLASEAAQKAADADMAKKAAERSFAKARAAEEQGRKLLYATDMQLAPFVWRGERTTAEQLRILLAKHVPGSGTMKEEGGGMNERPDLRGFEWYYYQHLLEKSAAVFSGHAASVVGAAFAPDGQLVTLEENGQLRRFDVDSQQEDEASRRDLPFGSMASARALSPDGRLAALAQGNKVHVFDASTGNEAFSINSAIERCRGLIFSRDSDKLVVIDDRIRWCSTRNGGEIASTNQKLGRFISLALSADGLTLAVVGLEWLGQKFSIFRLDLTAKGVTLVATDAEGAGTKVASALSPDGKLLAVSYQGGSMGIFETATGCRIARDGLRHPALIVAMAFSGDGAKLATGDQQGTIKIWADPQKLTSESAPLRTLKGHQGAITSIGFSKDGKRLVTTSVDKTARVWDLANCDPAIRPLENFRGPKNVVARFSPDGQLIAAPLAIGNAVAGDYVFLWDAATGRLLLDLRAVDDASNSVFSVAFSPTDSRLLATGCGRVNGSFVSLWDIDAGAELARLPAMANLPGGSGTGAVGALAFSLDGKYLVAGCGPRHITTRKSSPNPLKVWEIAARRPIPLLEGHSGYCTSLAFSKDGTLLASGSRDGTAMIWSTDTWKVLQTLPNPDQGTAEYDEPEENTEVKPAYVECVAFAPDGKTLAMASYQGTVHFWDVSSGKHLESLKGHSSAVTAVVFSPDGRTLASGGQDQTVRLWNVETRRELMQLDPGSVRLGAVRSLDFSPDGKQLLAAGSNAAVWSTTPFVWNDSDRAAERLRLVH
jgi:eukaryotic-like serine/threonine-protein kinase